MESEEKVIKNRNPRETANPISRLFFLHMIPTFIRNYKNGIIKEDLYEALEEHKSCNLGYKLESMWKKEYARHSRTGLHRALLKLVAFEFVYCALFQFFLEMILVVVPQYSIGKLVEHFSSTNSQVSRNEAKWHTGLIIVTLILDGVISHPILSMLFRHAGMKMRVACCSLIYRKSLRLSGTALGHTSVGQILNLISNDVGKLEEGLSIFHMIWIAPIQTIIGTYLLYEAIGISAFSGMGFLSLFIPLQIFLGKKTSVLRLRTALRTDERIRVMDEVLNGMQVIKMYTWEKPFAKLVSYIRRLEIKSIRYRFFLEAIVTSLETFVARTSIFISIIVFILLGNKLTPEVVYITTAIYVTMRPIITYSFSMSIACLAEMNISIHRIQKFMTHEELSKCQSYINLSNSLLQDCHKVYDKAPFVVPRICFENSSAKWQDDSDKFTLRNLNLTIDNGQLVVIIGSVGSGKSSLLNIIIKELPLCEGSLQINGKVSYAAQEPWLFSASVRQNILFGEQYDENRYKTVIQVCALETDLDMLPYGDRTLVGERGKTLSGGQIARINLARCIYKRVDIYLLDDPLSAVDTKVGKQLYQECITKFLSGKICILVTHQLQYIKNADRIIILEEGKIIGNDSYESLQNSCSNVSLILRKFNTGEVNQDVEVKNKSRRNSEVTDKDHLGENPDKFEENAEDGHVKAITYLQYFKSGGNCVTLIILFLLFTLNQGVGVGGDYFVCYWMNLEQVLNENHQNISSNSSSNVEEIDRNLIIYTYSAIIAATIFLSFGHAMFYFIFLMKASVNLHNSMFKIIMNGAMTFFNSNPTGRILNRFTKDIGVIDEIIPNNLLDVIGSAFALGSVIALTLIVSPVLLAPFIIAIILYYLIRLVCVETTRSLKRIEGIERSPLFSHISASIHGLSTIRALGAQEVLIEEFDKYQDNHSSARYLFITAIGAFSFWLESTSILFISLVITSLLVLNNDYYGGEVGLIVTQYMGLVGALQGGIRRWTDLENNMTSVERVLEYTQVETEPKRKSYNNIPTQWPSHGKIVFKNVSMKYFVNEQPTLTNLNFTINSCEKIGVVGRTGAGKTSIIAALFQMYTIDGSIIIDDVDTTKLPLDEFRSKVSIIPQEPMLFSGTIRKNLDPFEEFNDEVIWNALEQVELKQLVSEIPQGINCNVRASGTNFSVGQRQLICLARAIIRKNKILVMDEATANVDSHTDSLIQTSIRRNFYDCTVITIAHRLHTIMDADRVLVVEAGNVVEFDHPYNLLRQPNSLFYSMVQTSGLNAFKSLLSIANENFQQTKKYI